MTAIDLLSAFPATVLERLVIQRSLRVPTCPEPASQTNPGTAPARQLDAVLLSVGFKLSADLFAHLSARPHGVVLDKAVSVLAAARELAGDHVEHNTYFRDFPNGVPDTQEFWLRCITDALRDSPNPELIETQIAAGEVSLLDLPTYGTCQHSYTEMRAAHEQLILSMSDRVTVLHLGHALDTEIARLYVALAGSTTPLSGPDRELLHRLAELTPVGEFPDPVPVRENRAIINAVRLSRGQPLVVDTVTDVLRAVAAASGGDPTLETPTWFRSFRRPERRRLLACLDTVVSDAPSKLGDVSRYREPWKRLAERLHPHEYPDLPDAQRVFAVARGAQRVRSLASRVQHALDASDRLTALALLESAPGLLLRNLDRLVRAADAVELHAAQGALAGCVAGASGRVILSLVGHLSNRLTPEASRVFVNRRGRAWVTDDNRPSIDPVTVSALIDVLDRELLRRLPTCDRLLVDPDVLSLALPLSGKTTPGGFGVMPRGSTTPIEGSLLRFFIHWRQARESTDYDLSVLLLDKHFETVGHLSWTGLSGYGGRHSGDITSAPDGASELIDLDLRKVPARYIVPQVNIYSGEPFPDAAESFFGFMTRDALQKGQPFEPRTVRMRSELRGSGRVALPLVFQRDDAGQWRAKWMHLHLSGHPRFNRVEGNRASASLLTRSIVARDYLTVGHVVSLLARKSGRISYTPNGAIDGPVTFIGIERPEGLPEGSVVYSLERLGELVVA